MSGLGRPDGDLPGGPGRLAHMLRRYRWLLVALAVVLAVTVVGPFVYINFIKADPAERLSLDDVTPTTLPPRLHRARRGHRRHLDHHRRQRGAVPGEGGALRPGRRGHRHRRRASRARVTIAGTRVTAAEVEVDMTTFESDESQPGPTVPGSDHGDRPSSPRPPSRSPSRSIWGASLADGEDLTAHRHRGPHHPRCHPLGHLRADRPAHRQHVRRQRHHPCHVHRLRASTIRAEDRPRWATWASSSCSSCSSGRTTVSAPAAAEARAAAARRWNPA